MYAGTPMGKQKVALMIARVHIRNPITGVSTVVNALLDTGNTSPFLSKRVARALKLTGYVQDVSIAGISGLVAKQEGALVSRLEVCDKNGMKLRTTTVRVIENPAGDLRAFDWTTVKDQFDILRDIYLGAPCGCGEVDLILGVDWPGLLSHTKERISADGRTGARLTPFGWVAYGSTSPEGDDEEEQDAEVSLLSFRAEIREVDTCQVLKPDPSMNSAKGVTFGDVDDIYPEPSKTRIRHKPGRLSLTAESPTLDRGWRGSAAVPTTTNKVATCLMGEAPQEPLSPSMDRWDPGDGPPDKSPGLLGNKEEDGVWMLGGSGSADIPNESKGLQELANSIRAQWSVEVMGEDLAPSQDEQYALSIMGVGSRGCLMQGLERHPLWWKGSEFLTQGPEAWTKEGKVSMMAAEPKRGVEPIAKDNRLHPARFSSFSRCARAVARIRSWLTGYRARKVEGRGLESGHLTTHTKLWKVSYDGKILSKSIARWDPPLRDLVRPLGDEELQVAEGAVLCGVQAATFPDELDRLRRGEPVLMKSPSSPLCPVIDSEVIRRVGGRLKNSKKLALGLRSPIPLGNIEVAGRLMLDQHRLRHGVGYKSTLDGFYETWPTGAQPEFRIGGPVVKDLLPRLHSRGVWRREKAELTTGSVVALLDTRSDRGAYSLGAVTAVHRSRTDGFPRSVEVQIGGKTISRPVTGLTPLVGRG